jgi:hypothetical protein
MKYVGMTSISVLKNMIDDKMMLDSNIEFIGPLRFGT